MITAMLIAADALVALALFLSLGRQMDKELRDLGIDPDEFHRERL